MCARARYSPLSAWDTLRGGWTAMLPQSYEYIYFKSYLNSTPVPSCIDGSSRRWNWKLKMRPHFHFRPP